MKAHTSEFKKEIKTYGRQLNSIISYTIDGDDYELGAEELNSITPHFESAILKSAMRGLEIDSNVEIPKETIINYQFGVKVRDASENDDGFDYINYGDYIVKDVEKQEDTNSYRIVAYDYMLKAMVDYEDVGVTYPVTIRNYIIAICNHLGLVFKNATDTFPNYDKEIPNELYLDSDGKSLDYTFRDVFDELSQVTASTICIDLETNKLELRYITNTIGKNLLNRDNEVVDAYINVSGNVVSSNGYAYSDLIPVNQTNYVFSGIPKKIEGSAIIKFNKRIHGYDENGNWINQIAFEKVTVDVNFSIPVTISNPNIKYVRLSYVQNDTNLQFEEGTEQTEYEPFGLDKIDEEFLKDTNVNFGEKFGAINTIVLSRSAGADNIYYPAVLPENPIEYKISDNQIMNGNNRADYLPAIYSVLNGLEYYINDFSSTGICYYDICDRYSVQIGENTYSCVMFNDEVDITQGLEENIYTDMPEETNTDYTKADKDDRKINQTWIMVDKQNGVIESLAEKIVDVSETVDGVGQVQLENAHAGILHKLSISGQISLLFPQGESNLYGYPLVPSDDLTPSNTLTPSSPVPYENEVLYPSSTLYPRGSILLIDDVEYLLDLDFLNYYSATVFDEFVYKDGECWIIRRVGIDSQGNKYALDEEVIELRKAINLEVKSNSIIKLKSFNSAIYSVEYLLENEYTDVFATQVDVKSEITQTAGRIDLEVAKKLDSEEFTGANIILEVNKEGSEAQINADKINLTANDILNLIAGNSINLTSKNITLNSNNFNVDANGNLSCSNASITNGNINLTSSRGNPKLKVSGTGFAGYNNTTNYYGDGLGILSSYNNELFSIRMSRSYYQGSYYESPSIYMESSTPLHGTTDVSPADISLNQGSSYTYIDAVSGVNHSSREEYKKNIIKRKNNIELIKNTDVYEYLFKHEDDKNKKHIGLIIGEKYNTPKEIINENETGINLQDMCGVMWGAIKELIEENENLKKEMEELKNGFSRISK